MAGRSGIAFQTRSPWCRRTCSTIGSFAPGCSCRHGSQTRTTYREKPERPRGVGGGLVLEQHEPPPSTLRASGVAKVTMRLH